MNYNTNIFRAAYQQEENRLTYCFLSLLDKLNPHTVLKLLARAEITTLLPMLEHPHSVEVRLLSGTGERKPDGNIIINFGDQHYVLVFENKTHRKKLDLDQIRGHLKDHVEQRDRHSLLVVTTDPADRERLRAKYRAVLFCSWHDILDMAEQTLADSATNP
ncbi:MAG: hypothetical protein ACREEI_01940 [Stellaceae bacterium]